MVRRGRVVSRSKAFSPSMLLRSGEFRSPDVGPVYTDGQALESPTREPSFLPGRGWFGAFQMREAPQHQVQGDLRLKAGEHASDTGVKAVAETGHASAPSAEYRSGRAHRIGSGRGLPPPHTAELSRPDGTGSPVMTVSRNATRRTIGSGDLNRTVSSIAAASSERSFLTSSS